MLPKTKNEPTNKQIDRELQTTFPLSTPQTDINLTGMVKALSLICLDAVVALGIRIIISIAMARARGGTGILG